MELIDLEKIAEREKINVVNCKMKKYKARIINHDNSCIFMDYSKVKTYTEEKCLLAEELGHYYYDAYYSISASKELIDKQEYRSLKWRSLTLVPLQSILRCFKKRHI